MCSALACSLMVCLDMYFPQESELIESVEEEGKEDSAHSPVFEEKPKIQVSQHFFHTSQKYWSEPYSLYWLAQTWMIKYLLPVHSHFCLIIKLFNLLSPECHPPAAVGSVPLYDGPGPGPDGGYRDSQTLCLQPAGGSAHPGTTKLALPQGHIWNPCYWCAGRQRTGELLRVMWD